MTTRPPRRRSVPAGADRRPPSEPTSEAGGRVHEGRSGRAGRARVDRAGRAGRSREGFLTLEFAMTLPILAMVLALLLAAGSVVRDVLVLQEAARVGARVASTTGGDQAARWAAQDAAPELAGSALTVRVSPAIRRPGDQVQVEITVARSYGPLTRELRARSTARVEPILDEGVGGPATPLRPIDPTAPRGPFRPAEGGP